MIPLEGDFFDPFFPERKLDKIETCFKWSPPHAFCKCSLLRRSRPHGLMKRTLCIIYWPRSKRTSLRQHITRLMPLLAIDFIGRETVYVLR
jgi:hypothetical protein